MFAVSERVEELAERSGSAVSPDPGEAIKGRQVVVIAVKPARRAVAPRSSLRSCSS